MSRALASRPRARRHRAVLAAVAGLGAAALTFGVVMPAVPQAASAVARADSVPGTVWKLQGSAETTFELIISPESAVLDELADAYRFNVLVRNHGEEPLAGGQLRLSLSAQPAAGPAELLGGVPDEGFETTPLATATVAATPAGETQGFVVTVPASRVTLGTLSAPGVYVVRGQFSMEGDELLGATELDGANALDGGGAAADALTDTATDETAGDEVSALPTAYTPVLWRVGVDSTTRMPLTYLVPLVLPIGLSPMPTRSELNEALPRLTSLLIAAEARNAILAVDPRIIAAIRALGADAPAAGTELLERLEQTSSQMFLLQFADADPSAQAALGFEQLMQPTGLSFVTRFGTFEAASDDAGADGDDSDGNEQGTDDGAGTTEDAPDTEDTEGDASGVPSLEALLSWPNAEDRAWPADGQVDAATLSLLATSGITSLVLDSGNVTGATGTRVQLGTFSALITDRELGSAARSSLLGATNTEREAGGATLTALLAFAAEQGSAGAILALDRTALATVTDPTTLFERLDALDWVDAVTIEAQPEGEATLRAGGTSEERLEQLRSAVARSALIDRLAPLLEVPAYLTEYQRVRLMETFGAGAATGDDFTAVQERTRERDEQLLVGVEIVATENTQLVGTSSQVPITLHNALPFDARTMLRAAPSSAAIAVPTRIFGDVAVPSDGNATVLVPVRSRISSGESSLELAVRDAGGEHTFHTSVLKLTLRSSYETILLLGLGGITIGLLGVGIWRSIRRTHQAAKVTGMPEA